MRALWIVSWLGMGCSLSSSSTGSCPSGMPPVGEDVAIGWKCIDADRGGRVDIPDGAWLEVPPGALPETTRIVVTVPSPLPDFSRVYRLEPSGIVFKQPVILHIPYPDHPSGGEMPMTIISSSSLQETDDIGDERTDWENVEVTSRDPDANIVRAELPHFSVVYAFYQIDKFAYLVLDLPASQLQAGDIVSTLTHRDVTEGPNWEPGHHGMVQHVFESGAVQVMESSDPEGVAGVPLDAFKYEWMHLYLGPRRAPGPPLTMQERMGLVTFAQAQVGKGYHLVGQGNFANDEFSCVGLVEAAYDSIDRGSVPWNVELFALTPIDLFRHTLPITDVRTRPDQPIEIPMYGVTLDARSPYIGTTMRGWYQRAIDYTIRATKQPATATFGSPSEGQYAFRWTPTIEDGCETSTAPCPADGQPHEVVLQLDATPRATLDGVRIALDPVTIVETMTVHVTSHSRLFAIEPQPPNSGKNYQVQIPMPSFANYEGLLLRDEATKASPSATPFPNHTLTIVNNAFNPATDQIELDIRVQNTGNTVVTAPPRTLRYVLDYSRKRFLN